MRILRKVLSLIVGLIPGLNVYALNLLGHKISLRSRIGLSLFWCEKIEIGSGTKIGRLNAFVVPSMCLGENVLIRDGNLFKGNFDLQLGNLCRISRWNKISNSNESGAKTTFSMAVNSQITTKAVVDLTSDVSIGSNSQIAGVGVQIWTHGYVHLTTGDRIRVDGPVQIESNCYVGSSSCISPNTIIGDGCNFGSLSNIVGQYNKSGLYVSPKAQYKLKLVREEILENYEKKIARAAAIQRGKR